MYIIKKVKLYRDTGSAVIRKVSPSYNMYIYIITDSQTFLNQVRIILFLNCDNTYPFELFMGRIGKDLLYVLG